MAIHNLTPHTITIISEDNSILVTLPSEGVIRATQTSQISGEISGIPVGEITFGEPTGLEAISLGEVGDYFVVSRIAADSMKEYGYDTSNLLLTADPVRNADGVIIGCKMLVHY